MSGGVWTATPPAHAGGSLGAYATPSFRLSTSIGAFVDFFAQGDMNKATRVLSFADFERNFGGLNVDYPMSYAVQQFYQNGGSKAVIVRLYKSTSGKSSNATVKIAGTNAAKPLVLTAQSSGTLGNTLRARVDDQVSTDVATQFGLAPADLPSLGTPAAKPGGAS